MNTNNTTMNVDTIMKQWKKEAGVKHVVCWGYQHRDDGMYLIICTDRPGLFIGPYGHRHEKFKQMILVQSSKTYNPVVDIAYIESRGIC